MDLRQRTHTVLLGVITMLVAGIFALQCAQSWAVASIAADARLLSARVQTVRAMMQRQSGGQPVMGASGAGMMGSEPLSWESAGFPVRVEKTSVPFPYDAGSLSDMAQECGTRHQAGYFGKLVGKFAGMQAMRYSFAYQGTTQGPGAFVVTLLPNAAGYADTATFKKDFDLCAAGGDLYPVMASPSWLMFTSSCGTGYDDGSGRPDGCTLVRERVERTLRLAQ